MLNDSILLDFITVIISCSHEYLILFKKFNTLDINWNNCISNKFKNIYQINNIIIKQFKKIKKLSIIDPSASAFKNNEGIHN